MDNKYILAIHFQYMNDGGKLAEELFNSGNPFIASIVPNLLDKSMKTEEGEDICGRIHDENIYYSDWAKEIFRDNWNNPRVFWVQEGYRHCCGKCYNKKQENNGKGFDPYHEHICLDGTVQSLEKQIEVIGKGKKLIKDELGIEPLIYCPPNHLYNEDSLKAARKNDFAGFLTRNGFDYFISGLINFPIYEDDAEITVFPETKKGNSPVIMTYYDHICDGRVSNWRELLKNSEIMEKLCLDIHNKPKFKGWINEKLIRVAKRIRDKKN